MKIYLDQQAITLREQGHEALDARDCGLRGKSDDEVFKFAQKEGAIVFTSDLGFGNFLYYPVGSHSGIVIVHFPNEVSTSEMNRQIGSMFEQLSEEDFKGSLVILEPSRIRLRRR